MMDVVFLRYYQFPQFHGFPPHRLRRFGHRVDYKWQVDCSACIFLTEDSACVLGISSGPPIMIFLGLLIRPPQFRVGHHPTKPLEQKSSWPFISMNHPPLRHLLMGVCCLILKNLLPQFLCHCSPHGLPFLKRITPKTRRRPSPWSPGQRLYWRRDQRQVPKEGDI